MNLLKPILLVEDNPNDVELTLTALSSTGLANDVVVTRDGAEAKDYLFRQGIYKDREPGLPTVVLLDLKLPKIDGLELLQIIRDNPNMANLPVVILTSSREERDVSAGYDLGSNAYVVKPVAFNDFIKAIQDLGIFWAVINEPPPGAFRRR
ncbi:MAG TPA: response regulator [Alloacidobacterium sp.]|nr:response regulator [Alloacidobacterium sp.]